MKTTTILLSLLTGLLLAGNAAAQTGATCPQLPTANLQWESRATDGMLFCRAVTAEGSEAFGLVISSEPSFTPERGNRREQGSLDRQGVFWYRAEIAAAPGIQARETLLQLADGRYAHVWLQADSQEALIERLQQIAGLRFGPAAANPQVAGN